MRSSQRRLQRLSTALNYLGGKRDKARKTEICKKKRETLSLQVVKIVSLSITYCTETEPKGPQKVPVIKSTFQSPVPGGNKKR